MLPSRVLVRLGAFRAHGSTTNPWLVGIGLVAVAAIYFDDSAVVEERLLDVRFAGTHRDYRRATTMFVPFVL